MTFKSWQPDIHVPSNANLWSWLFENDATAASSSQRGFTDAITKEHISYADLKNLTTSVAGALEQIAGVRPGEVVSVFSKNSIWYPVATLAAARLGAIACAISPEYTVGELRHGLGLSKTKILFTTKDLLDKVKTVAEQVNLPLSNIFLLDRSDGNHQDIRELARQGARRVTPGVYAIPQGQTNHQVCAFICFSSGTTGLPKAVMISHANIIAQCLQIIQITPKDHDKILAALPFNHITGIVHELHLPIALNADVYILGSYNLERCLQAVEEFKIKELLIVPPILIHMVRKPDVVKKYDLSHVQRFSSGAAPLSKEILTLLEKQFPGTGFKQGYGMTESCSAICSHPPFKYSFKYADKVGMVVPSTEIRLVSQGKDCGVNEEGEVWARGPQVVMGYLDNPSATAETFDKDGFLHTGDIGYMDEEGMLSITDRIKEMIKVKGIGVAPAELENLLLGHQAVEDCAVCGIPDERAGERPKAFVVISTSYSKGPHEAATELLEFVRSKSSRYKHLAEVEVVEKIPKSPSGKILRKVLRKPRDGRPIAVVREATISKL